LREPDDRLGKAFMNHIFGPVNSRRLGRSLGIDLLPKKICNFDCIYCEVGTTTNLTCERGEYVPTGEIIAEIEEYCSDPARMESVDVVTVTASGEPTLHAGLGRILRFLKERTGKPVAVLTNGTNLSRPDVVADLSHADVIIPSLDTVLPESFRRLNRPARCVDLEDMIEGLVRFSHEFRGEIWLEILLVRGVNDNRENIDALIRVIRRMKLSRVQLNTVARPPLEKFAQPVSREDLQKIAARIAAGSGVPLVEIIAHGISRFELSGEEERPKIKFDYLKQEELIEDILHMLQRRPCTTEDINRTFALNGSEKVGLLLEPFVKSGKIRKRIHEDKIYFQYGGNQDERPGKA
jgi:wyosine [tRNA(Phe)-imidazoG37] synthetase (radical SAM superfamily)